MVLELWAGQAAHSLVHNLKGLARNLGWPLDRITTIDAKNEV
jgi:hypothetical protein